MAKNDIIEVLAFGEEIGKVGYDENRRRKRDWYKHDGHPSD